GITKDAAEFFLADAQCLLGVLSLSDVLSRASQPRDSVLAVAYRFASIGDPSRAAIWTNHLQINLVWRAVLQRFRDGSLQAVTTFRCIQVLLLFIGGRGQIGIAARDSVELFGPGDHIGFCVPAPTADLRHALCL